MDITELLALADDMPAYRVLAEELSRGNARALVIETARPYLIAALYRRIPRSMLVVTARADAAKGMAEQLASWLGIRVLTLPEHDTLPYQRLSSDFTEEIELIAALTQLVDEVNPIMVASATALTKLLPGASIFKQTRRRVSKGDQLDPVKLMAELVSLGYRIEALTELPGQTSRRGGIIDIFSSTAELPARLEFFGNSVDRVCLFDPISQRSIKPVDAISFGPASVTAPAFIDGTGKTKMAFAALDLSQLNDEEKGRFDEARACFMAGQILDEVRRYAPLFNRDNVFSYLPDKTLVVIDDPEGVRCEQDFMCGEAERALSEQLLAGGIPLGFPRLYHTREELDAWLGGRHCLVMPAWGNIGDEILRLGFDSVPGYAGQLTRWLERVSSLLRSKKRVLAVSHQAQRLAELLENEGLKPSVLDSVRAPPVRCSLTVIPGILAGGWVMGNTHLFTDREIFGFIKRQRLQKRRGIVRRKAYIDIRPGDYVVHVEHGIGRLSGIISREVDGCMREYMLLVYAEGSRLYVPTDQVDRVTRYVGASDAPPPLSRLGSLEWVKSKERARTAAEDIARDLLKLYAARELVPGFIYSPDNAWQVEMEAAFPYVETPDQLTSIAQIKEDMAKSRPMDRLVTGDVGYGKTEVALRAAFKAVMDGKQVAVLVPTTVLAQQHFTTFSERLAAFPVKIEMLSRFRSPSEQRAVIESLAQGGTDIVIGTHRLLQKDVVFKDLGLVIIDEEQRFGVSHKEHFKRLRQEVGVLALSATPIPRTLHMSLAGVRDMSVMETPPEERLPIKTYVAEYDERLVREAIVRELERNGQVFFVHNRVQSIMGMAEKIRALVPEARLAVGHGQMDEDDLEMVMTDFMQGRVDVLLCTTIIESGLDVPSANTLIVNQADRLGLTQLYQLRGRVGRGANLAHAYFLYDRGKHLTEDAGKRLRTIFEATELGAGFDIAMRDLEIRGAGNILGVRQSGHISAVGYSYYTQLLAEAVDDLKAERAAVQEGRPPPRRIRLPLPTIDLPLPVFIPEEYVPESEVRLSLYQRLAGTREPEAADMWAGDLKDRFGKVPTEVENLIYAVKVKIMAIRAVIAAVSTEGDDVVLRRPPGIAFDVPKLRGLSRNGIKLAQYQIRLSTEILGEGWQRELMEILKMLGDVDKPQV